MNSILKNQNNPEQIKLLKASTVAYEKVKYWEIRITYFLLFLAFAYPITYIIIQNDKVKLTLFGCSFLLTVLVYLFYNTFKGNTSKGALFKEEFDVNLFGLPWKSTIKKVDHNEVSKYSILYKGTPIKDWYSTKLADNVPKNIAVAVCQHSNTSWDIDLRKKYVNLLKGFLIFYSIGLFLFFVFMDVNGQTIFSVCFSIQSFFTNFVTMIRGHSAVIDKREAISKHLDEIIRNKKSVSIQELRDIQDDIYLTRQEPAKVPNFFFNYHKKDLSMEMDDYISTVNTIYA